MPCIPKRLNHEWTQIYTNGFGRKEPTEHKEWERIGLVCFTGGWSAWAPFVLFDIFMVNRKSGALVFGEILRIEF